MRAVRVLAVAIALVATCAGCDWAQLGADAGHTNANPFEPAFTVTAGSHFATAWSTACTCLPPLESGGIVYVADGYGGNNPRTVTLRALDAVTHATRWTNVFPNVNSASFLAIGNGLAYVDVEPFGQDPYVLGLDATTGDFQWFVTPPAASPEVALGQGGVVLDGATLFLADDLPNANALVAIDTGGHIAWTANPPGYIDSIVGDGGSTVYAASHVELSDGSNPAFLTAYAQSDGTTTSTVALPGIAGLMSPVKGVLYVNDRAIVPSTGAVLWSAPGEGIVAVDGSRAITVSSTGDLVARNALTGVQLWRATGAGPTAAGTQTMAVAGSLIFVAHPHVIDVRSLADGSDLGSTPAVSQDVDLAPAVGHLFVDGADTLYAFAPTAS